MSVDSRRRRVVLWPRISRDFLSSFTSGKWWTKSNGLRLIKMVVYYTSCYIQRLDATDSLCCEPRLFTLPRFYSPRCCLFISDNISGTGCASHFENLTNYKIVKEPLLVLKQTIPQQKALDLSFNLAPWKWAWHYHEAATPSRREKHRCAWGKKSYFRAGGSSSLMIMPRPHSGCQIKAEIKGFLLRHYLFQCKHWFLPNFELKDFSDLPFTQCRRAKWFL